MGMMLTPDAIDPHFLLVSIALVGIIVLTRYASVAALAGVFSDKRNDRLTIFAMLPRGLASAVLATLPVSANVKGCEQFINYTFAVIVMTNILMTIGVFMFERKRATHYTV